MIVINETFVRRHFPDEDPIGKQVVIEQIITGQGASSAPRYHGRWSGLSETRR